MSTIGQGKTAEGVSVSPLLRYVSQQIAGAANTVYYNGYSATTNAVMIDTQDYDDVDISLLVGTVLGEGVTVSNAIYASDTNTPMAASAVTGASFTAVTNASGSRAAQEGAIGVADQKRYICLVTTAETHTAIPFTVDLSGVAILGKSKSQAVSKTLVFDV
jgi:hypothetical protein